MTRIAILTTHPIQYNAPMFARLAARPGLEVMVFYTWSQSQEGATFDPDFNRTIAWDIPLLEGYGHRFVENHSRRPGSDHFRGMENPTLLRDIKEWAPDVLIVYSWCFRSHLACLRYFNGRVPILFRGDSTLLDERPGFKRFVRRSFLTWVYRHIDIALSVGYNNQAYYLAHGIRPAQLVAAPHAVDNDRFRADDERRTAAARERRRTLGIGDDKNVLLFAGKLEAKKDPAFLVRLAARLKDPSFCFLIVGNGHLEKELKASAAQDDRIRFMGFQNQQAMPEVYRMADVLVLPSRWNETWGLAVNEAMACGRPVIVSDRVGCAPDLVEQGETGWVFPADGEPESKVAIWLQEAAEVPGRLADMGIKASRKVEDYSIGRLIEGIERAIQLTNTNKKKAGSSA